MSMAAPGSLTPLPSPASPASPLRHGTPFPFKVKSQFLYRLAQESENNSTTTTTTTTATTTTTTATTTIPVQRPPPPLHRIADHPRVKCVYTITPHSLSPTHITQSSITSPTPHILTPAHTPSLTPAHTPTHITPSSLSSPPTSPGVIAEDTRGGTNLTPESPVFQTPLPFVHPLLRTSPLAYPPYAHAHAHAHAQAQAHAHAHRRHLSESDLQRRQGGMYWDTAHLRHLQKLESRQRAYRHSLYHAHSYHRSRPRHSSSGVDGPIMLSEEVKGPYLDGLPSLEPTVSSKDVKESTKDEVRQDYMKKAVSEWTTDDVVDFLMGTHTHADYDFSIINTMNGAQLMRQSREFFLRFSPEYGEDLYNEVQRRVLERATSITSTPYQVSLSSTTTTSPLQRPFLLTAPPHTLRHLSPQPSVICDAQAPYELVIDPQAQLRFAPDPRDPSVYEQTHRGAMKIVPPPLVALERREERQVTGDRGVGAGSSGEQVQGVKEEVKIEPPKKRGPGRPKKPESELKKKKKKTGRLWEFIRNLLLNPETCPSMVKWENPEEGLFRFIDGEKVAKRWGERKGNKEMNYEKLSRAMRYYYKTQIFEAVIGRRLVYKFGKKASGWRTSNPNFANPPENPSLEEPTPAAAPPPPPPHHHHYDQLHSDLKPKTSQGDLVLSSPQHHHYEQLHTDLKQKTSQGDLVLSSPQHHHYEQLHTDLKQKTSQGDLVLSPPQHHLHHYTTQLLLPELKAPPPPAHHYKENFLSSPHAQDTKSHLTHPLSLTMHHTPHHHHHHHHT